MKLFDDGWKRDVIAKHLGISPRTAMAVYYNFDISNDLYGGQFKAMIVDGTRKLGAAIETHHGLGRVCGKP